MLKVKMPSVTSAVKQLADMGLVEYTQYAPVKLTPQAVSYTHIDVYKRQGGNAGLWEDKV